MQKENIQHIYSLTPLQEGLFFHYLTDRSSGAYFVQAAYRVRGSISPGYVEQALNRLAERYDILRTSFVLEGLKKTFQVVLRDRRPEFLFRDISATDDHEQFLLFARQRDRERGFDLTHDPLMRLSLFQLGPDEYEFIWSHHHILMDGWCTGIIIREFTRLYEALLNDRPVTLPPVVQYKQFVRWIERRDRDAADLYWQEYLRGYDRKAGLTDIGGTSRMENAHGSGPGIYDNREIMTELPDGLFQAVRSFGAARQVSLNVILQTLWGILLSCYTDQDDVVFGKVVSIRPPEIEGVETMVGLFINTVPVRIDCAGDIRFSSLVQRMQREALDAEAHQHYPLADIQAASPLKHNLLDHVFVFGNYPLADQLEGMQGESGASSNRIVGTTTFEQVNYGYSVHISGGSSLRVRFNYNGHEFSDGFIRRLADHYLRLIGDAMRQPDAPVRDLEFLSGPERDQLLHWGRGAERSHPGTLDSRFRQIANARPDDAAVTDGHRSYSFSAVEDWSSRLAATLQQQGIVKGDYILVKTGRILELPILLLAIWKTGAVYIPIDPGQPNQRVRSMLEGLKPAMLLTTSEYLFDLPETGCPVFAVDLQLSACAETDPPQPLSLPEDPAYIIFTSGTTGRPKGVPILHRAIVDRADYHVEYLGIGHQDKILVQAGMAFDASIIEMTMGLLSGATLCMASTAIRQDPELLIPFLRQLSVTVAIFPPATLKLISPDRLAGIRHLISTGEAPYLEDTLAHAAVRQVHNGYGPTETCIGATFHQVDPARASAYRIHRRIPIGRPFSNTRVYVLDCHRRLSPPGVTGELYVAGIGLSPGYLGDKTLTAARFTDNPVAEEADYPRVYATGDLVCWNEAGELLFIGRRDEQVQIRGIRVELSEIESLLLQYPGLTAACVKAQSVESAVFLVAYFTVDDKVGVSDVDLLAYLRRLVPEYMIPARFVRMAELPRTSGGKVDRQTLPAVNLESLNAFEAPVGAMEKALAKIWEDILEKEPIGRMDNFFEIGGHSLKATQIVSAVYKQLGIRLDIGQIFSHPRIALLAQHLSTQSAQSFLPITPAAPAADYPVTPSQRRIWVLSQLGDGASAYHIRGSYLLEGQVDPEKIAHSVAALVKRHSALRTNFRMKGAELRQVVFPYTDDIVRFEYNTPFDEGELHTLLAATDRLRFDPEDRSLFSVGLFRIGDSRFILTWVIHHLVADGWSIRQALQEIARDCDQPTTGRLAVSSPNLSYADYAVWLSRELEGDRMTEARNFWTKTLRQVEPLNLPADFIRPAIQTFHGARIEWQPDMADRLAMTRFAAGHGISLFNLLLSAVILLLRRLSGQPSITVGSIVSGREHPDTQTLIGCFINTLVLSARIDDGSSLLEVVEQIAATTTKAYAHQDYPFDRLVEEVRTERDLSRSALFDVLVNFQSLEATSQPTDADGQLVGWKGVKVRKYGRASEKISCKFDLEFEFYEEADSLSLHLIYNTSLFAESTVKSFLADWRRILSQIVAEKASTVKDLLLADPAEESILCRLGSGAVERLEPGVGMSGWVHRQVKAGADRPAVLDGRGEEWSYGELWERVLSVSGWLRSRGVGVGGVRVVVGVSLERRCGWLAVVLGIWRAGGIYLPLDRDLPAERRHYMAEDAGARWVITDGHWEAGAGVATVEWTDLLSKTETGSADEEGQAYGCGRDDGSYLIYTSGSTGRPKGVLVGSEGVINHLWSKVRDLGLGQESRVAQSASMGFDVSVWQLGAVLLTGGLVRLYERWEVLEAGEYGRKLQEEGITVVQMVPSYVGVFLEQVRAEEGLRLKGLRYLVTAGEELRPSTVKSWMERYGHVRIANCYGPTEATDNASMQVIEEGEGMERSRVPIGRPLRNVRLYVLDRGGLGLVPRGMLGEIGIGGIGVSEGYVGQSAVRTEEVFVSDPYWIGGRLYRTGDLGRWNERGELEYHGRSDRQVKVRGQRLELGEVERVAQEHAGVKAVAVVYRGDEQGGSLRGYVVWKGEPKTETEAEAETEAEGLRSWLAERLPGYMVPAHWVSLEELPETSSGKVDYRQLEGRREEKEQGGQEPWTEVERELGRLWSEVLGVERIGREENFFQLGGHSLSAMRLAAAIETAFNTRIQLQDIFKYPTIQGQGELLATLEWLLTAPPVPADMPEESVWII